MIIVFYRREIDNDSIIFAVSDGTSQILLLVMYFILYSVSHHIDYSKI